MSGASAPLNFRRNMMKTLTYWINKLSFIFMLFFLSTTIWILTHPIEISDGMLVYPSAILWHIIALFIFIPTTLISYIAYRDWDYDDEATLL